MTATLHPPRRRPPARTGCSMQCKRLKGWPSLKLSSVLLIIHYVTSFSATPSQLTLIQPSKNMETWKHFIKRSLFDVPISHGANHDLNSNDRRGFAARMPYCLLITKLLFCFLVASVQDNGMNRNQRKFMYNINIQVYYKSKLTLNCALFLGYGAFLNTVEGFNWLLLTVTSCRCVSLTSRGSVREGNERKNK